MTMSPSLRSGRRLCEGEPLMAMRRHHFCAGVGRWRSGQGMVSAIDGHDRSGGERLGEAVQVGGRDVLDIAYRPAGRRRRVAV